MASNHSTGKAAKFFALVSILAMIAIASSGCSKEAPRAQSTGGKQEPIDVVVGPITYRDVQRGIDVTGTLFADDEAEIAAQTPGRIVAVLKDVGDEAKVGELLAQVDRTDYELLLLQREAAVSEALSRLGLEEMPAADFDLATLPAVQRAQAQERNALARFNRGKELFTSDPPLISEQDYADLETSFEVAQHNVKAEMLAGRTLLSQARSRLAEVQIVKQQLKDADILTPTRDSSDEGYLVAERRIAIGEYVAEGQAVFALVDVDPIKFRADAPERFAGVIKVGQAVLMRLDAFDTPFEGRITRLSPQVDQQSRTFEFEAEIANGDGRLKPGSFAIGNVRTELQTDVAFVPTAAVVTFAGVKRIFSIADGKAVEHRVQTGVQMDDEIEIIADGLPRDAMIVVKDAHRLVHGAAVTMTMESASNDASRSPVSDDAAARADS